MSMVQSDDRSCGKSKYLFFTGYFSSSDASLAEIFFYMIHSQISWPRSGDCGGAGFEPGTAANSKYTVAQIQSQNKSAVCRDAKIETFERKTKKFNKQKKP
jgi:hypothetical protein